MPSGVHPLNWLCPTFLSVNFPYIRTSIPSLTAEPCGIFFMLFDPFVAIVLEQDNGECFITDTYSIWYLCVISGAEG
jgi:hypothetical protein